MNRRAKAALHRVNAEIAGMAAGGFFAAGLASEGYAGGYRDALMDMDLALRGVKPHRRNYWDDWEKASRAQAPVAKTFPEVP